MAQQTVNIGSSANKGDGDPLRTAFTKINENFTELYADIAALEDGNIVTDIKGNVFAEDSTLLVDAINGVVPAANLTGALPAINGSSLTGVSTLNISTQTTSEAGTLGKNNVSSNKTPSIATTGIVNITRAGADTTNNHYVYLGNGESVGSVVYVSYDNNGANSGADLYVLTDASITAGAAGGEVTHNQMSQFVWNGSIWYRIETYGKVE